MKQSLLILFLLIPLRLFAPSDNRTALMIEPINPFLSLWSATCQVESGCNSQAINETEQAVGIAQIRPIRVKDYNERTGNHYSLYDCLDSAVAYKIYMFYASKYGPMDIETIARNWNGSGEMTKDYWKRIKSKL